jgi:hypothetical protein
MDQEHANTIPISEILGKLHLQPSRREGPILEYPSILDRKRQATLVVNTLTNRWSDANQQAGTVVELVCQYLKSRWEEHTEADALRWINNMLVSFPDPIPDHPHDESALELRQKKMIQYPGLIYYLKRVGIPLPLARQFLKEVHVRNRRTSKDFMALGLPTIEGGFALRTAYLERHLGPLAISFIRGTTPKPKAIHLFKEGLDYLSVLCQLNQPALAGDAIVLNAWSCLPQVTPYIRQYGYKTAYSWLDNTPVGEQATASLAKFLKTEEGLRHQPMNKQYADYPSVHAWHMAKQGLKMAE